MSPMRKGDGTGLSAKGFSEVRKGDGTVLWNAIPDSGISQEEDGDLSEYVGDTSYFDTVPSPTISGSDHAISYSTDGVVRYVEASFSQGEYDTLSMHVYPEDANNELMFVDSGTGNVVHGIYFRSNGVDINGIYYSGGAERGSITNGGSTSRDGGVELVSAGTVSSRYYHIELINIDYDAETLDIAVDGSTVVTDISFILSGVPDIFHINSNFGSSTTAGYVDKVDTGD